MRQAEQQEAFFTRFLGRREGIILSIMDWIFSWVFFFCLLFATRTSLTGFFRWFRDLSDPSFHRLAAIFDVDQLRFLFWTIEHISTIY